MCHEADDLFRQGRDKEGNAIIAEARRIVSGQSLESARRERIREHVAGWFTFLLILAAIVVGLAP
jgi:hypothetical protein